LKSYSLFLLKIVSCLVLGSFGFGQATDSLPLGNKDDQSLGEVVKRKSPTAHASKVLTDEDPQFQGRPIPDITPSGELNSAEIVRAILKYSASHDAADTEKTVKTWYQDEMDQVAHARSEIISATKSNTMDYEYSEDPEVANRQYREQAALERQRSSTRAGIVRSRNDFIHRLHDGLYATKTEILKKGLLYPWFDVNIPYVIFYGPVQ
jgi:hypothetical protein